VCRRQQQQTQIPCRNANKSNPKATQDANGEMAPRELIAFFYTGQMARARQTQPRERIDPETWLRGLPKAELHLHLEGSITAATLVELSRRNDARPLTLAEAAAVYSYTDFPSFLMSFKAVTERLHTADDYELITYNMLRDLAAQGVRHAEAYISIGILYHFARLDVDAVMAAVERGRERAESEFGVRAGVYEGGSVAACVSKCGWHRHRRR
jgi:hypothetical protein